MVPTLGELKFAKSRELCGCPIPSNAEKTKGQKPLLVQAWIEMEGRKADQIIAAMKDY